MYRSGAQGVGFYRLGAVEEANGSNGGNVVSPGKKVFSSSSLHSLHHACPVSDVVGTRRVRIVKSLVRKLTFWQ